MNLSIRTKLLAGFSLVIVLLVFMSIYLTGNLAETSRGLTRIVEVSSRKVSLSQELLVEVLEAGRHEKNIILATDPVQKDRYLERLDATILKVDSKVPEIVALVDDEGKRILDDFNELWEGYKVSVRKIVELAKANDQAGAFKISIEQGLTSRERIREVMDLLIEKNQESMVQDKIASDESYKSASNLSIVFVVVSILVSVLVAYWIITGIGKRISSLSGTAERIASREFSDDRLQDTGKDELRPMFESLVKITESFKEITENANRVASGNFNAEIVPRSSKDILGHALLKMTTSLRDTTAENQRHTWLTTGQNELNENMRGDVDTSVLANRIIHFLARRLDAQIGSVYMLDEQDQAYYLMGKYAFSSGAVKEKFLPGEGLIGQAAVEKKLLVLDEVKEERNAILTSVFHGHPANLVIIPFLFEDKTMGVIELGRLTPFTPTEHEFLRLSAEIIGIGVNSAIARTRIQRLLEETQAQSEELQTQQEELKQMNEELEELAQNLKHQQEELQMTNEELEEQTQALEEKNREVEAARSDIEKKSQQLEVSSKYKSEFLANMSHELRTPLNSLLILSRDLAENKMKNLTGDQVESAEIINKSGHELLALINEVLDLSKIEAGKMTLNLDDLVLQEFAHSLIRNFKHQAHNKGLELNVELAGELPEVIRTDDQRLNQVIKNLLSNALKFTDHGSITVKIQPYDREHISIAVTDTGVGIPEEKQMAVFEAFQQADGSTARKYGGTGLGLSISRELVKLLHGELRLQSKPGEGSTFTLILPVEIRSEIAPLPETMRSAARSVQKRPGFFKYPTIEDDRANITEDDKVVLVIEDDEAFARVLRLQASAKGIKSLVAATGEDGLALAEKYKPHAILLDIQLPGMDGNQVLAELKATPSLRHIPVHILSANERTIDPIKEGAVEYLTKPVNKKQLEEAFSRIENFINRKMKNLLIIEDDANSRKAIRKLIGNGDVECFDAATGKEAIEIFREKHIDCIVLDIGLPDISGFDLIHELNRMKHPMPPVIIYTGKELTKEENDQLQKYAETIIIKGVKSEERLLDETALFLHRTISNLPESKQRIISNLYDKDLIFQSKRVLLVDDDMRNVFALSKILKEHKMEIVKAENGLVALDALERNQDIDIVLMDIMMPEMDGYEAMRRIRQLPAFRNLPIIALTAKAMKEDKQKCIDAGANDYITKPVDVDRLLTLMRVWLSK